jgi:serine protease Do
MLRALGISILFGVSAVLAGCVANPVKQAAVKTAIEVPQGTDAKPIQFRKVVVKLSRGQKIGDLQIGLACVRQGDLNWKGGRLTLSGDEFTEAFRDELVKSNYPVVGNPDALFEDPSEWKAELLVAGLVKTMEANLCFPNAGFGNYSKSMGGAYVKVDWQVFSRLDRKVVFETSTEGSYQTNEAKDGTPGDVLINAFAISTQNLLANQGFHDLVTNKKRNIVEPATSVPKIKISLNRKLSAIPIQADVNSTRAGVVTVFAGNGHGSGFFIGKSGYLLTNEHVVREAKFVKIKLVTGREILGDVIRTDARRDVALIKAEDVEIAGLPTNSNELSIGSDVYAVGTPLDKKLSTTITKGIISAYRSEDGMSFIQSDVQILPGNSGGPLLDSFGNVAGIAVKGIFMARTAPTGLNFFIPIADALKALGVEGQ